MNNKISNIIKGDKVIWMVFLLLCLVSVIEVFSSMSQLTYKSGNYLFPFFKHIAILMLGICLMIVTLNIKCKYFKAATPLMLIVSILGLIIVFFLGQKTNGAVRWIPLFGIQFQPSEIAKGTLILACAQILSAMQTENGADRKAFKYVLSVCAFIIPLIFFENFSTAALLFIVVFIMMLIGRVPLIQLGKLMGVTVIVGAIMFTLIMTIGAQDKPQQPITTARIEANTTVQEASNNVNAFDKVTHRFGTWRNRILRFVDNTDKKPQDIDLQDKDLQTGHANIAIASSQIWGKGPGGSEACDFLSQAFSDFIFAIIIEELGIVGAVGVVLLYVILLFRTGRIASRCENNFPAFLAMGLAILIVTQAVFNMCVAVGLAPVTGQPLPLISKGGTSTIMNCIYIGVILSVSRSAKKKDSGVKTASVKPAAA